MQCARESVPASVEYIRFVTARFGLKKFDTDGASSADRGRKGGKTEKGGSPTMKQAEESIPSTQTTGSDN